MVWPIGNFGEPNDPVYQSMKMLYNLKSPTAPEQQQLYDLAAKFPDYATRLGVVVPASAGTASGPSTPTTPSTYAPTTGSTAQPSQSNAPIRNAFNAFGNMEENMQAYTRPIDEAATAAVMPSQAELGDDPFKLKKEVSYEEPVIPEKKGRFHLPSFRKKVEKSDFGEYCKSEGITKDTLANNLENTVENYRISRMISRDKMEEILKSEGYKNYVQELKNRGYFSIPNSKPGDNYLAGTLKSRTDEREFKTENDKRIKDILAKYARNRSTDSAKVAVKDMEDIIDSFQKKKGFKEGEMRRLLEKTYKSELNRAGLKISVGEPLWYESEDPLQKAKYVSVNPDFKPGFLEWLYSNIAGKSGEIQHKTADGASQTVKGVAADQEVSRKVTNAKTFVEKQGIYDKGRAGFTAAKTYAKEKDIGGRAMGATANAASSVIGAGANAGKGVVRGATFGARVTTNLVGGYVGDKIDDATGGRFDDAIEKAKMNAGNQRPPPKPRSSADANLGSRTGDSQPKATRDWSAEFLENSRRMAGIDPTLSSLYEKAAKEKRK